MELESFWLHIQNKNGIFSLSVVMVTGIAQNCAHIYFNGEIQLFQWEFMQLKI